MAVLTLLSRAYCHLCDEMRDAVHPVAEALGAAVVEVDVDAYPHLEAAYGDRVPLLMLGAPADGRVLCQYRYEPGCVESALGEGNPRIG
jgi:hypothetical protein